MCDLKANLNINMSLLCKLITLLILIIKQSNQSFTVLYLMILNDQIMIKYWWRLYLREQACKLNDHTIDFSRYMEGIYLPRLN